jgi:hypothetical protein
MSKKLIATVVLALAIGACAHHKDVRPGDDGINRVVLQTDDVEGATRKAIKEANHYCKSKGNQEPAFVDENQKYTGDMDEQTYKNAKRMSKVAKTVGGAVWVFGGQTERTLGGIAGIGGVAADEALGKGYTVEMRFRCR